MLAETLGVSVPPAAVRRVTEGVGAVAEADQQRALARAQQGQQHPAADGVAVLVVAVDGVQVHLEEAWHEMKVGRVAPLGPVVQTDKRSGRTILRRGPSVCCAGLETAETFWYRVYALACRGGWGPATRLVVVLGDGAEWIWQRAAHFLGGPDIGVLEIVDIFHAYEHLWTGGRAVCAPEAEVAAWVEPLNDALYEQGASAVLAALAALTPQDPAGAAVVQTAQGYLGDHAARRDSPRFGAQHLPLGSGAIESACKSLIEARAKGAGMRWSAAGAQAVASLRALHRSGAGAAFWAPHPLRQPPYHQPRPRAVPAARPAATVPTLPPPPPCAPTTSPPATLAPLPGTAPRRPAPSHPWPRLPLGRARCA